jgi:hypothetical protein
MKMMNICNEKNYTSESDKDNNQPIIVTDLNLNTSYSGKLSYIIDEIIDNEPQIPNIIYNQ